MKDFLSIHPPIGRFPRRPEVNNISQPYKSFPLHFIHADVAQNMLLREEKKSFPHSVVTKKNMKNFWTAKLGRKMPIF